MCAKESERKKEDQSTRKGKKSHQTVCFSNVLRPRGPKSRLAKAVGVEASGGKHQRDEKLHVAAAGSTNMHKTHQVRSIFGS